MNLLDAAYNVVHDYPGGAQSLAPRMGKSATSLSHEVTATGTAKLGLLDAAKITQLTGNPLILEVFAMINGKMLLPLPDAALVAGDECLLRLADTAREFGELCKEIGADLADNVISDNELDRINRDGGELIASIYALLQSLERRNREGKPSC